MAFDNNQILKGLYSGALVDIDESDVAATSLTVNPDGNAVVEINETGKNGLAAVLILTEEADSDSYGDKMVVTIEASDYLDRNWETVAAFPTLYTHLRVVPVKATTAFVASDIGKTLTETTSADTGEIIAFDEALKTVGGTGNIWIAMDAAGDVFDEAVGTVETATSGTGVGKKAAASYVPKQMQPGVFVQRFATDKKYVRSKCTAEDNFGKGWILLTDNAFKTI